MCLCVFVLDDRWAADEEREKRRCRERRRRRGVRRDGNLRSSIHDESVNVKTFKKRATILREVEAERQHVHF